MTYDFLHHLTQAPLPVVIYDEQLIGKLNVYENQSLIVTAKQGLSSHLKSTHEAGIRVLKITMAGRRAVRRHLKASQRVSWQN